MLLKHLLEIEIIASVHQAPPAHTGITNHNKREQTLFSHQMSVEKDPKIWKNIHITWATNYHPRVMAFQH